MEPAVDSLHHADSGYSSPESISSPDVISPEAFSPAHMPDIMAALPSGAVTRIFSRLENVQLEAERTAETLEKDGEENLLHLMPLDP